MRAFHSNVQLWVWGLVLAGFLGAIWIGADHMGRLKDRRLPPTKVVEEPVSAPVNPTPVILPPSIPKSAPPPPPPAVAEAEDPILVAERDYEGTLAALAKEADRLEGVFTSFLPKGWQGRAKGGYVRAWYAVWDGGMEGQPYPAQTQAYRDLVAQLESLRQRFQAAEEEARRAGVYPGTRRALRAKHRLDDRLWER